MNRPTLDPRRTHDSLRGCADSRSRKHSGLGTHMIMRVPSNASTLQAKNRYILSLLLYYCVRSNMNGDGGPCNGNNKNNKNDSSLGGPKRQPMIRDDVVVGVVQARSLHTGVIPATSSSSSSSSTITDGGGDDEDIQEVPLVQKAVPFQTASTTTLTDEEEDETTSDDDDTADLKKTFIDAILRGKQEQQQFEDDNEESYFRRLLADGDQLERILISRKYELGPSVDLFWEQVRFRDRWKPDQIRPADISTALSCEFHRSNDYFECVLVCVFVVCLFLISFIVYP
jgi:hypothetical protein